MCRLRIPGGVVKSYQLRELAAIARELTTGYIQITTRNNFQIRLIEPKNCPEVLRRIQACGLHSRGAGADNIRNITMNPCAGLRPARTHRRAPAGARTGARSSSHRASSTICRANSTSPTTAAGSSAPWRTRTTSARAPCAIGENTDGIAPGRVFPHRARRRHRPSDVRQRLRASSSSPEQLNQVIMAHRARLHPRRRPHEPQEGALQVSGRSAWARWIHREDVEALLAFKLTRLAPDRRCKSKRTFSQQGHSHVGVYPQKQDGLTLHRRRACRWANSPRGNSTASPTWRTVTAPAKCG